MISLGRLARDGFSGFVGRVNARAEYVSGNVRVGLVSSELHEGKVVAEWFDEKRLVDEPEKATDAEE